MPSSIKTLGLSTYQLDPYIIPESVEDLYLRTSDIIEGVIPDSVKTLRLLPFSGQIHCLPKELISLDLGYHYNEKINGDIFPDTLKNINFGALFNKPLSRLPSNMDTVRFGTVYKHPLPENFTAKQIKLPRNYPYITDSLRKRVGKIVLHRGVYVSYGMDDTQ